MKREYLKRATKTKFMQSFNPDMHWRLLKEAKKRAIDLQELLRAVIIPEWLERQHALAKKKKTRK